MDVTISTRLTERRRRRRRRRRRKRPTIQSDSIPVDWMLHPPTNVTFIYY
jgi:hypothetical protein